MPTLGRRNCYGEALPVFAPSLINPHSTNDGPTLAAKLLIRRILQLVWRIDPGMSGIPKVPTDALAAANQYSGSHLVA